MEADEADAVLTDGADDPLNRPVGHLVVAEVAPPADRVGPRETVLGDPLIGIVDPDRTGDDLARFVQMVGDRRVDPVRIDVLRGGTFGPDEDVDGVVVYFHHSSPVRQAGS